jgi:hypothetical protein
VFRQWPVQGSTHYSVNIILEMGLQDQLSYSLTREFACSFQWSHLLQVDIQAENKKKSTKYTTIKIYNKINIK